MLKIYSQLFKEAMPQYNIPDDADPADLDKMQEIQQKYNQPDYAQPEQIDVSQGVSGIQNIVQNVNELIPKTSGYHQEYMKRGIQFKFDIDFSQIELGEKRSVVECEIRDDKSGTKSGVMYVYFPSKNVYQIPLIVICTIERFPDRIEKRLKMTDNNNRAYVYMTSGLRTRTNDMNFNITVPRDQLNPEDKQLLKDMPMNAY